MESKRTRYSKEVLVPIVAACRSFAQVLRAFGLKPWRSSSQALIKARCREYGISTAHFLGQGWNKGGRGRNRIPWRQVLCISITGRHARAVSVRRAMIESGIAHVCSTCGQKPVWMDKPLVLQIDHRNGNRADNRKRNIRFLCPNCHSQTENFGKKNGRVAE